MDFLTTTTLQTTNTDLASCLCAVGIPLMKNQPIKELVGDRKAIAFFFEPVSPCGLYHTQELILAWDDKEWHLKHPEHPFAYLKTAFQNRARLRDMIKGNVPTVVVKRGDKFAFLSLHAEPKLVDDTMRELKR